MQQTHLFGTAKKSATKSIAPDTLINWGQVNINLVNLSITLKSRLSLT